MPRDPDIITELDVDSDGIYPEALDECERDDWDEWDRSRENKWNVYTWSN